MDSTDTPTVTPKMARSGKMPDESAPGGTGRGPEGPRPPRSGGGLLTQYKPDQGKVTRTGTFIGLGLLIAWGAMFVKDHLVAYEGDEAWRLLITPGIPILFAVVMGVVAWRVTFASRKSSDFMIATEGEMKKVSWSSRREVIGSTKVVIAFTVLMALLLFGVDLIFQYFFRSIGILRV